MSWRWRIWVVRWMVGEVCVFFDCVDRVWREHREVRRLKRDETTRRSKGVERRRVMGDAASPTSSKLLVGPSCPPTLQSPWSNAANPSSLFFTHSAIGPRYRSNRARFALDCSASLHKPKHRTVPPHSPFRKYSPSRPPAAPTSNHSRSQHSPCRSWRRRSRRSFPLGLTAGNG